MKFSVEKEIFEKFPQVRVGALVILGMSNQTGQDEMARLLADEEEKKAKKYADLDLKELPQVSSWQEIYQAFGSKPKEYRSSIEALLRRVQSGKKLPNINPLVDLYNYVSLKHLLPVGAEDLDKVKGEIVLGFAQGTESGKYLGSEEMTTAEEGEVIYKDNLGFICRRWNWREGDRTKITEQTRNVVVVLEATGAVTDDELAKAMGEIEDLVREYLGGKIETKILKPNDSSWEVDFGTGKKLSDVELETPKEGKQAEKKAEPLAVKKSLHKLVNKEGLAVQIVQSLYKAVIEVVGKSLRLEDLVLEHPSLPEHGDYATNVALKIHHPDFPNPVDLANKIVSVWRLSGLPAYAGKIDVIKPGFINLWLSDEALISQTVEVLKKKEKYGSSILGKGKTVVVDYSAPNIAKPFGVGHLRSTDIGQAIYNFYHFLGFKTIGDNHLGDWGTQFGKLVYQIEQKMKNEKLKLKDLTVEKLEKLYVDFHKKAETHPEMEDEARAWFKRLEDGDKAAKLIWQKCIEVSLKEFERIYKLLDVKIDYAYGESFYEDKMPQVIDESRKKKLAVESQGALVIPIPVLTVPVILLKSDGATTYETRELATIKFRQNQWHPDLIIWEVGADQKLHFQKCFAAAQMLRYGQKEQFVHVAHGLIRWVDGKFSTREGKTIHLEEVLDEAIKRAEKVIKKSETGRGLSAGVIKKVAKAVGIGAVKYTDLKQNPQTDIVFDWDRIFTLEGDSGPYLQYTYARCRSVLKKSKYTVYSFKFAPDSLQIEERELLRLIYRFPEIVIKAAETFSPNLVSAYLFDLAQKYNLLYNRLPILKGEGESRQLRLILTCAVAQILRNGLGLLGIEAVERM